MAQPTRLRSIDVAKGIGILAIVLGHLGWSVGGHEILEQWIYPFHVTIFFVVAGYFSSNKKPFKVFVKQKARRLLLPYALTCVVILLIELVQVVLYGSPLHSAFGSLKQTLLAAFYCTGSWYNKTLWGAVPMGAIWFLVALFIASLFMRFALHWRHGWLINLALALLAYILSRYVWLPFNLQAAAVGALFMSFGHFLRKHDFIGAVHGLFEKGSSTKRKLSKLVLAAILLGCTALYFVDGYFNLKISCASLLCRTSPVVGFVLACASCVFLLALCVVIERFCKPLCAFFEFYGKGSLIVLCLHLLMQTFFMGSFFIAWFGIGGNVLTVVNFCFQMAIFSICIPLFKRIRPLRWVFY